MFPSVPRRPIALTLVFTLLGGGCIGSFKATNAVLDFNRGVSDSIVVQELVFLGFVILPVYEIVIFVDAVVLNLVEAITGDNPLAHAGRTEETRVVDLGDQGTLYVIPKGKKVALEHVRADGTRGHQLWAQRNGDRLDVLDGEDHLIASAFPGPSGELRLVDPQGVELQVVQGARPAAGRGLEGGRTPSEDHMEPPGRPDRI